MVGKELLPVCHEWELPKVNGIVMGENGQKICHICCQGWELLKDLISSLSWVGMARFDISIVKGGNCQNIWYQHCHRWVGPDFISALSWAGVVKILNVTMVGNSQNILFQHSHEWKWPKDLISALSSVGIVKRFDIIYSWMGMAKRFLYLHCHRLSKIFEIWLSW